MAHTLLSCIQAVVFLLAGGSTDAPSPEHIGAPSPGGLEVIADHQRWVDSSGQKGSRLDLSRTELSGADLRGADLSGLDLRGVNLSGSDLRGADLSYTQLEYSSLSRANLSHAYLSGANLKWADLSDAELIGAQLNGANLTEANLSDAGLDHANLFQARLTHANLGGASLSHADADGANLEGTSLHDVDMSGMIFEPETPPEINELAAARNLEFLTYQRTPLVLTQLRKQFQDGGFREQERKVTYALNREEAERAPFMERWLKRVAFEFPCQYGMNPGRLVWIWLGTWLTCSLLYGLFMALATSSGLYLVIHKRGHSKEIRIRPLKLNTLRSYLRISRAAMLFSLMSACHFKFQELEFGSWLRMLTKREYDLRSFGWARTISGLQSLISLYLLALWVLTYFGRPFG